MFVQTCAHVEFGFKRKRIDKCFSPNQCFFSAVFLFIETKKKSLCEEISGLLPKFTWFMYLALIYIVKLNESKHTVSLSM